MFAVLLRGTSFESVLQVLPSADDMQRQMSEQPRQMRVTGKEGLAQISDVVLPNPDERRGRRAVKLGEVREVENYMLTRQPLVSEQEPKCDCPICGERCWYVFETFTSEVVGCDVCLKQKDVTDYWEEEARQFLED